jgi:hypothetical protein
LSDSDLSLPRPRANKWRKLVVGLFLFGAWSTSLLLAGSLGYRMGAERPVREAFVERPDDNNEQDSDVGPVRTDENGKEYVSLDLNRDGFFETRQYEDADGRMSEQRIDQNKDGKVDLLREYSEDGKLTHESEDENLDGKFDRWLELDSEGVVTRQFFDLDFDGQRDAEAEMNERGHMERIVTKLNGRVVSEVWYQNAISQREVLDMDRNGELDTELLFDKRGVLEKINKYRP